MAFNAGAIEATLTLDRTPFQAGARAARSEAEKLGRLRPTIRVDADTAGAETQMRRLSALASSIGGGSIRIGADTAGAQAQIRALQRAAANASQTYGARLSVNSGGAQAQIAAMTRAARGFAQTYTAHLRVDASQARAVLESNIAALRRWTGTHTARLSLESQAARSQLESMLARLRSFSGTHTARMNMESEQTEQAERRIARGARDAQRGIGGLKAAAITLGPALIPVMAAAAGATLTFAGAMGTAALGFGIFGIAAKSQLTPVFEGFKKLTQAREAYAKATTKEAKDKALAQQKAALQGLNPLQVQAVQNLFKLKEAFSNFGKSARTPILQTFNSAIRILINLMRVFEPVVKPVALVIRNFVGSIERATTGPGLKRFANWLAVAAPAAISVFLRSGRDVAVAIGNIFKAFSAGGKQEGFLRWVRNVSAGFRRWTENGGLQKFVNYFNVWGPKIAALLGAISRAVGYIIRDLAPMGGIVVTVLLPFANALAWVAKNAPWAVQGVYALYVATRLYRMAALLATGITTALSVGYSLLTGRVWGNTTATRANTIAQRLNSAARAIGRGIAVAAVWAWNLLTGTIFRNTAAVARNTAVWIAHRAVAIGGAIRSAAAAFGAMTLAAARNSLAMTVNAGRMLAVRAAAIAVTVATRAWTAAQWLWNAAISANPIGIIIIAIAALVAGFIYAYKHSATFRNIVNGALRAVGAAGQWLWKVIKPALTAIGNAFRWVWTYVKKYWWALPAILLGPLGIFITVVAFVATHWKQVVGWFNWLKTNVARIWRATWNGLRGVFNATWNAIRGSLNAIRGSLVSLFGRIRSGIGGAWNATWTWIRNIFNYAWGKIRGSVNAMVGWLTRTFRSIRGKVGGAWNATWTWIRNIFNFAWGKVRGSIGVMASWLGNKFRAIRNSIGGWWNKAWTWIRNIFNFAWGKIRGSIGVMGQWLGNKFHSIRNSIGGWWNKAWTWIRNIFNFAWGKIRGSIGVMGQWLGNKFHAIRNSIGSWWNKAWTWIRNIFNFAWGKLRGSIGIMGQWLGNKFHAIRDSIGSWWNKAWTWIRNIFNFAWGKLRGSLGVMGQWMGNKFHSIRDSLVGWWDKAWHKIRDIFNWTWGKIRGSMHVMAGTMKSIWNGIVSNARTIWEGIKKVIGRPINFVIGFVADRLVPMANAALRAVGVSKGLPTNLGKYKIPGVATGGEVPTSRHAWAGFAGGGVLPGYSPGRDNMLAYHPRGPVALAGGEGILRPEVMRAPGTKEFLNAANYAARSGGVGGVKKMLGFANGGIIPSQGDPPFDPIGFNSPLLNMKPGPIYDPIAHYDGGGIVGKIFSGIRKAANVATSFVPGVGSLKFTKDLFMKKGFDEIFQKAIGGIFNKLIGGVDRMGAFGNLAAGAGRKIVQEVINWVTDKTTPQSAYGDLVYRDASKRLSHALSWAKSQAGKPYQWGGGGNPSYDCSGFMASIQRVINGQGPGRLYTTHDFHGKTAPSGWQQNLASPFMVGVTNAGVGHMAGTLINNHVESAGSRGVNVGGKARGAFDPLFKWHYGYKPVVHDAKLVGGGNGKGGPMAGMIGSGSSTAMVGTFWDTGHSGYGDTGAPASGKPMHKFALASRNLIPYGKTAIMQAYGQKRMAAFESIDYGPGITSRLFDIDTYGAAWLFGRESKWSGSNPGRDVSPGVFRVHWKRGYDEGGDLRPGYTLSWNGTGQTESVVTSRWRKQQEMVNDMLLKALAAGGMGSKTLQQTNHLYEVDDAEKAARKILQRTVEGLS